MSENEMPQLSTTKKCLFWIVFGLIVLVVVELVSHVLLVFASKDGRFRYESVATTKGDPFHPYLGWVNRPNLSGKANPNIQIQIDERGYSVTPLKFDNPEIRIVVLGGSTMFGTGASSNSGTVPSSLERLLYERMGIKSEVTNLAVSGYQSFQEMLMLDRYFAQDRADLVLAISGRNDPYYAVTCVEADSSFIPRKVWRTSISFLNAFSADRFQVHVPPDFMYRVRSLSATVDLGYRMGRRLGLVGVEPDTPEDELAAQMPEAEGIMLTHPNPLDKRVRITATHYACIDTIARANGARFIMALQPTLFFKDHWTLEEKARYDKKFGSGAHVKLAELLKNYESNFYDEFRVVEKHFKLVDLSNVFRDSRENLYTDHCHYNDNAAELFAGEILRAIKPDIDAILNDRKNRK